MPCSFFEVRSKIFISKKVSPIKLTIYTNKLNNKIKTKKLNKTFKVQPKLKDIL